MEATLDVQPIERVRLGGTYTFVEGDQTIAFNPDVRVPLNGFSIAPQKITAYLEHLTVPEWEWRNRVQGALFRQPLALADGVYTGIDPTRIPSARRNTSWSIWSVPSRPVQARSGSGWRIC